MVSLRAGAKQYHLSAQTQVKSQAPDTDAQSPLPHAFAIGLADRFGVTGGLSRA